jgi:D-arabinose 5-phosphate isomerase GutQ
VRDGKLLSDGLVFILLIDVDVVVVVVVVVDVDDVVFFFSASSETQMHCRTVQPLAVLSVKIVCVTRCDKFCQ